MGRHFVCLGVKDDDNWSSPYPYICSVYIYKMDLDISGVPEDLEASPGAYVPLGDLVQISLAFEPNNLYAGYAQLTAMNNGNTTIKVWEDSAKTNLVIDGSNYKKLWNLGSMPTTLYVEGCTPGVANLYLEYSPDGQSYPGGPDLVKVTVVRVDLTASGLYGTVAEPDEETPGAFIHFNLDNDDSSDNSVESPQHPGADYANNTGAVAGENDLKSLTMAVSPSLDNGVVVLTNTSSGKIWKSSTKGSANLLLGYGSLSWDLSDPNERSDFLSLCPYVEGAGGTGGEVALRYYSPYASLVHLDKVKYTFIAADCGDQPRTESEDIYVYDFVNTIWVFCPSYVQRGFLEGSFTGLARCEYSITHNLGTRNGKRCTLPEYNCIAWSVGETNIWYNPEDIARDYGDKDNIFEETDMDDFYYKKKGWSLITSGTDEEKAKQAEAMYYSGYHGARKKGCGCGAGKWIMYESKCGQFERIEHAWNALNGSSYGYPTRYYR